MKMRLLFTIFCLTNLTINGQTKLGTVNSELIIGLMPEAEKVLDDLRQYALKLDSSYQVKLTDYNAKVEAFQKLDPSVSDNFKKVKIDQIKDLELNLQKSQQNATNLINLRRNQLMGPIYTTLGNAIKEIASAENFTQILTSSGNEFAYIKESFDITEKVINKLGLKIPPPPVKE